MKAKTDQMIVESCRLSVCPQILYIRSGSPQLTNVASYDALSGRWLRANIKVEGGVTKRAHVQGQRPTNTPQRLENVKVQYPVVVDGVFKKRCMTFHMNVKARVKPKNPSSLDKG